MWFHIRQVFLKALEEERSDDLPGDVYARGFIHNYAVFLDLPSEELLALYAKLKGEATGTPSGLAWPATSPLSGMNRAGSNSSAIAPAIKMKNPSSPILGSSFGKTAKPITANTIWPSDQTPSGLGINEDRYVAGIARYLASRRIESPDAPLQALLADALLPRLFIRDWQGEPIDSQLGPVDTNLHEFEVKETLLQFLIPPAWALWMGAGARSTV